MKRVRTFFAAAFIAAIFISFSNAQTNADKQAIGSTTAKNGFKNEDTIRDKFNDWRQDDDAKAWLKTLGYKIDEIESVTAAKPHGEKADVEVTVKAKGTVTKKGISIKLVSNASGFNQIDKRWLSHYAKMWKMPDDVYNALKLFVGEIPPVKEGRDVKRMYLNELTDEQRSSIIRFFETNRDEIVSDLFGGDGAHAADWIMVAYKPVEKTDWILKTVSDTIKFYSEGKIEVTRAGNLKIGRITMQRKGGDGGRETAKMLQFKINPVQLFDAK